MMKLASHAPVDAAADQVYWVTFAFNFDQSMKTGRAQTSKQKVFSANRVKEKTYWF